MSTIKLLECAPTKFQKVGDIRFACRELGELVDILYPRSIK